jgi:uncharacterized protein involved in type VI secretion and phage assembly
MNVPGQPKAVCISARIMGMDERFHVHVVHGHEGLGVLFEYQVDLSNQNEPDWKHSAREPGASLKPQDLLGKTLVIALPLRNEKLPIWIRTIVTPATRSPSALSCGC